MTLDKQTGGIEFKKSILFLSVCFADSRFYLLAQLEFINEPVV